MARWYARCRKIDIRILWPSCLKQARDLNHARAAFATHAFHDPAWLVLGAASPRCVAAPLPLGGILILKNQFEI